MNAAVNVKAIRYFCIIIILTTCFSLLALPAIAADVSSQMNPSDEEAVLPIAEATTTSNASDVSFTLRIPLSMELQRNGDSASGTYEIFIKGSNLYPDDCVNVSLQSETVDFINTSDNTVSPLHGTITQNVTTVNAGNIPADYPAAGQINGNISVSGLTNSEWRGQAVFTIKFQMGVRIPPTLASDTLTIEKGSTGTIVVNDAGSQNITYTSSDTTVATVNTKGIVTGVDVGTIAITVQVGDVALKCTVTVTPKYPVMAPNSTWYKGTAKRTSITEMQFVNTYTPTGKETESWNADVDNEGDIKCYIEGTKLIIAGDGTGKILANPDSSKMFGGSSSTYRFNAITTIDGLDILDTSNATKMDSMFYGDTALTTLNLSSFNVSEVTTMSSMFRSCGNLTNLNLSSFNKNKTTNMTSMFYSCSSLLSLDLQNVDTSNVTAMGSMFYGCSNLKSLDLSNFNTHNVTGMGSMFWGCKSLTSLDLTSFDTGKLTNMGSMFNTCSSLVSLDLSNFDTSNVTSMSSTFSNCSSLASLDLSMFNTDKVTDMNSMFTYCTALTSLDISNFDTSHVKNVGMMFSNCQNLTTLNLSNLNISSVTKSDYMFRSTPNITIYVSDAAMETWIKATSSFPSTATVIVSPKNALAALAEEEPPDDEVPQEQPSENPSPTIPSPSDSPPVSEPEPELPEPSPSEPTEIPPSPEPTEPEPSVPVDPEPEPSVPAILVPVETEPPENAEDASSQVHLLSEDVVFPIAEEITASKSSDTSFTIRMPLSLELQRNGDSASGTYEIFIKGSNLYPDDSVSVTPKSTTIDFKNTADNAAVSLHGSITQSVITIKATDIPANYPAAGQIKGSISVSNLTSSEWKSQVVFDIKFLGNARIPPTLTPDTLTIEKGSTGTITVNNAGSQAVTYTPSNPAVATVDTKGIVTAVDIGTAIITVQVGDVTLKCTVTVTPNYPVMAANNSWYKGKTKQNTITEISFVNSYIPDSSEKESWNADANNKGDIKCYIVGTKLIIAGNGTGKIVANKDSSRLFSHLLLSSKRFGAVTSISGLDLFDTSNVTNMDRIFYGCSSLLSLNLSNFDTRNVTDMGRMFEGCSKLTSLDLSNLDTGNVTNMGCMFWNCTSLSSLNVSHLNTNNVTDMSHMFQDCTSLASLNLSGFDTSKVTDMQYMFNSSSRFTSLDLSSFNTGNVKNMSFMFEHCTGLTSLNVSTFDTSNVTDMNCMFYDCSNLKSLDTSNFNTSKVTRTSSMFEDCTSLTFLDVSHFDTSKVTKMNFMFGNCVSLASLDVSHFDTSNATDMCSMFRDCRVLTSLNVSNFSTSNVTDMSDMFLECFNLTSLDVSKFNTSKVKDMSFMFNYCSRLTSLDLRNFDFSNVTNTEKLFGNSPNLTIYVNDSATKTLLEGTTSFPSTATVIVSPKNALAALTEEELLLPEDENPTEPPLENPDIPTPSPSDSPPVSEPEPELPEPSPSEPEPTEMPPSPEPTEPEPAVPEPKPSVPVDPEPEPSAPEILVPVETGLPDTASIITEEFLSSNFYSLLDFRDILTY